MRVNVHHEPSYILHTRSFRETSQLLEVFSRQYGRVSLIARGSRGSKSKWVGVLQPFVPLSMSWVGKGSLYTVQCAERLGPSIWLEKTYLISAFYLNELLVRLLPHHDPHATLYDAYAVVMQGLFKKDPLQPLLRRFERLLLSELGYGLKLTREADTERFIRSECYYRFEAEKGFYLCDQNFFTTPEFVFKGSSLIAFHEDKLQEITVLRDVKRLMRLALRVYLGRQKLVSYSLL